MASLCVYQSGICPCQGFYADVSSAAPMSRPLVSAGTSERTSSNPMLQASANSTAQLVDKSTRFQSLDASIEDTVGDAANRHMVTIFDGSVQNYTPQGVFCGSVPILISDASFDVTRKL